MKLRKISGVVLIAAGAAAISLVHAQTLTPQQEQQAAAMAAQEAPKVARHLKIRHRHRRHPGTHSGSQTTTQTPGTNGSGNTAHTTNNNSSDNNQNNSNNSTQTNHGGTNLLAGLVNVNVSNINLNVYKLVDVHNVLNNSQVEVLTQKI